MRNLFGLGFLLIFSTISYGQLRLTPIAQSSKESKKKQMLTLPFWDDFSASHDRPDTTLWLFGSTVYVNATVGANPPTYKTATFDGLNGLGKAYGISALIRDKTDSLISHPINMTEADQTSTFISFYWQAKGNGEAPDKEDSIRLQLKSNDTTALWQTFWVKAGDVDNFDFQQEIIPINDPIFFHDSLQFKFEAFGSLNGQFDTWNIDYIYLNDGRGADDLNYNDRALSGSPSPLFGNYTQIPFAHLAEGDSITFAAQSVLATNLSDSRFNLIYRHLLTNESLDIEYSNELIPRGGIDALTGSYIFDTIFSPEIRIKSPSLETVSDSQIIASTFIFFTEDEEPIIDITPGRNLEVNDTIKTAYLLHDQYAYDDGSAEFAAGINLNTGMLAVRYIINTRDTLNHIRIYFPDIAPDANGSPIDLIVWGKNLEKIRVRQPYTISKLNAINEFTEIKLENPIIVSDTFHIGYEQFTDNFIGLGFDRNNPEASSSIFTNITGEWQQNERLTGALMIRPVFKRDTTVILSQKKNLEHLEFTIFPNPAKLKLYINGEYDHIEMLNLSGQLIYRSSNKRYHDLIGIKKGLFLVKIFRDNQFVIRKLIVE
jgi:hypothetical protein